MYVICNGCLIFMTAGKTFSPLLRLIYIETKNYLHKLENHT